MDLCIKITSLPVTLINIGLFMYLNLLGLYTYRPVTASHVLRPRGVSLAMASFYDPSRSFTCFDGSGTISFNYINDDYCDCEDGSDEPGTAACLNGIFHCANAGHMGKDISSSFVNDGVCDCCDTSDEYGSDADCLDVCQVLGEAARAEARHKAEVQMEGYNRRQKMAEEGSKIKKERQIRITELGKEKEKAELERAEKLASKEAAEEPENVALEQYKSLEEEIKARKEKELREKDENDAKEAFADLDADNDGILTIQEVQLKETFDTNRDGIVSEDEAKFYLHQKETVDLETFPTSIWPLMKPTYLHHKTLFIPPSTTEPPEESIPTSEEEQVTESETQDEETEKEYDTDFENQEEQLEEEEEEEGEEEEEDYADELDDVEIVKEKEEAEKEEEIQYDPETQKLIDIANAAREEFKVADNHLRDLTTEIKNLQEGLQKDFGPNEEFRVFEGRCYEFTDREYIYRLCPFDSATQKPKNGHGETRLGTWGHWAGPAGNPYSIMKYTGGQACWNGPQRSAEVKLSCGIENELTAVTEPSRCEYLFLFITPAVCSQPDDAGSMHQHTEL